MMEKFIDRRMADATKKLLETPVFKIEPLTPAEVTKEIGISRTTLYAWINGNCLISRKTIAPHLHRQDIVGKWAREVNKIFSEQDQDAKALNMARCRAKSRQLHSILNLSRGGKK